MGGWHRSGQQGGAGGGTGTPEPGGLCCRTDGAIRRAACALHHQENIGSPNKAATHRELVDAAAQGHHRGVGALGDDHGARPHAAGLAKPAYLCGGGRGQGVGGGVRASAAPPLQAPPRRFLSHATPRCHDQTRGAAQYRLHAGSRTKRTPGPRTRSAISSTSSASQPSLLANARASFSAGGNAGRDVTCQRTGTQAATHRSRQQAARWACRQAVRRRWQRGCRTTGPGKAQPC